MAGSDNSLSTKYAAWRKLVEISPKQDNSHPIQLWSQAFGLLSDADEETARNFISDLLNPSLFARKYIDVFLNNPQPFNHSLLFLGIISHRALLDCPSINTGVENLYRFIGGISGGRGVRFCADICSFLLAEHSPTSYKKIRVSSMRKSLVAISITLCQAVRCDKRVIHSENMPGLLASIERIILLTKIPNESGSYSLIMNRVQTLQRLIYPSKFDNTECGIPANAWSSGCLDQYHKLDITSMRVLPTYIDVRRVAVKSLPSVNLEGMYSFNTIGKLLGAHFHLLRHDSLGALEIQVKKMLRALRNNPDTEFKSSGDPETDETDCFIYEDVHMRKLLFSHGRGLEIQLSLRSLPDRICLQEGALVCLVVHHARMQSIMFFVITQGVKMQSHNYLNRQQIRIIAKPAQLESQEEVDSLIQRTWQRKGIRSILVEFPEVLLPTFVPVLKNLQRMQRENWLPIPAVACTSESLK